MLLTLLRHGIAQVRDGIIADADRKLTAKGVQRTQASAMGLASCCMGVELILTSPKIRALQTAQIASEVLDVRHAIETTLAQEELPLILQMLEQHAENHLMLVGHEPTFTQLAQYLCSTAPLEHQALPGMTLKKAGALQIELDRTGTHLRRPGKLLWLIQPSVLRQLGM